MFFLNPVYVLWKSHKKLFISKTFFVCVCVCVCRCQVYLVEAGRPLSLCVSRRVVQRGRAQRRHHAPPGHVHHHHPAIPAPRHTAQFTIHVLTIVVYRDGDERTARGNKIQCGWAERRRARREWTTDSRGPSLVLVQSRPLLIDCTMTNTIINLK